MEDFDWFAPLPNPGTTTVLDTRDVFFLVPPSISGEPIN